MASEAAALLDELMGQQRNALPGEKVRETRWSDPEVCRHFLCGFCPSELFTNTKSDIGPCDKLHDERLKNMYQESERCGKLGYEDEFLHYLEKLVRDLDRRIERGRERLQKSVSAKQKVLQGETGINSDKLKNLNDEINMKVAELDTLGTRGLVEEAQQLMKRVEDLERERERERMHLVNMTHKRLGGFDLDAHDFHEKMELCDVCGSFLVIGDVQLRVDAHLLGKQHLGFARIRATIAELKKAKEDKVKRRHDDRDGRSGDRDGKDAADKGGSADKEIKLSKDEEKEIVTKGRTWRVSRDSRSSRSRSRERDHGRQVPRSREQRPRSPEKEGKSSRSTEREGNRRRSRSHSRDREQPAGRRNSSPASKEKRDERQQRSRSRSRERRKEEDSRRAKDREGKERSKEEKPRQDRPREERSREEKPREDRSRERDKGREERKDRDRSGRPREREERDKPKDREEQR